MSIGKTHGACSTCPTVARVQRGRFHGLFFLQPSAYQTEWLFWPFTWRSFSMYYRQIRYVCSEFCRKDDIMPKVLAPRLEGKKKEGSCQRHLCGQTLWPLSIATFFSFLRGMPALHVASCRTDAVFGPGFGTLSSSLFSAGGLHQAAISWSKQGLWQGTN